MLKKEEEIDFRFVRTFADSHHKKIEEQQTNLREGVTGAGVTGAGVVGRGEGPFVGLAVIGLAVVGLAVVGLEEVGLIVGLEEVGLTLGDNVLKTNGPTTTVTGLDIAPSSSSQSAPHVSAAFVCKVAPKVPSSMALLITFAITAAGGLRSNSSAMSSQLSEPHFTLILTSWT